MPVKPGFESRSADSKASLLSRSVLLCLAGDMRAGLHLGPVVGSETKIQALGSEFHVVSSIYPSLSYEQTP